MFATCVENNQIFVPTSENTWNYESSMERKTSLVTSVVRVTQPSNIYKFTRANIPVRNLIAVRNVEKHLLTQVLWKITRNSTNTTSRSHVRYVERLLRSRRTWKATWWYTTQTQTSKLEKIVHPKNHEFSFFGYLINSFQHPIWSSKSLKGLEMVGGVWGVQLPLWGCLGRTGRRRRGGTRSSQSPAASSTGWSLARSSINHHSCAVHLRCLHQLSLTM